MADRAGLVNRTIPEIVLSDGSSTSMTPATAAFPSSMSGAERASARFSVDGNAIITGGAGTLALSGARALLEHGLKGLGLVDINLTHAEKEIAALRSDFPDARIATARLDVTKADEIEKVFQSVVDELGGGLDVLCCYAGIVGSVHALDTTAEDFRRLLDINTTGGFLCAQAAARIMSGRKSTAAGPPPTSSTDTGSARDSPSARGGSIVFIASVSGHIVNFPQPQTAYNVSKSALHHMARSLASEWAIYGIRVNTISPGYMDTILNEGSGLERCRKLWMERNPTGRMGAPAELTGPLVLLCSRYAGAYITGADIKVDGGMSVF